MFDKKVFSETIEVLKHTDKEIVEKIPDTFKRFLLENMDKENVVQIDFSKENWEETILEDTKALLALIYRDYIVSAEEKEQLLLEEKQENGLKEKNKVEDLLKNRQTEIPKEIEENTQLEEIHQYPWYKRLYKKILSIFGK